MPEIETIEIDDAQQQKILELGEDHFTDLKAIEIQPAKLTQTISAFANTSGGEIYVGIDERADGRNKIRTWRGFADVEEANSIIQVLDAMAPLANHYNATFLRHENSRGLILQIAVFKTAAVLEASNGTPYVRRGAQKLPVNDVDAVHRLKMDKGVISFEDHTVEADLAEISNSIVIIEFLFTVIPTAEPEPWIGKQKLSQNGKPVVAGALLFAEEPQALLPKRAAVKILQYKTRAKEGERETLAFDPLTIEGPIYKLIEASVAKTKEIVEGVKKLGPEGLEAVSYPDETLHEIITNAVLHRDYSLASDVQIRIYDNRIEVQSPGKLPAHVTVANILDEQSARNPKLVRIINKFPNPPNKDVGEGLNTAFQAMTKMRLQPPEIIELDNAVLVQINHTPLASPEEAVMDYLNTNAEITNSIARELTGITSENTMKLVFYRLRDSDMIEPVPGKGGSKAAWRLIS